MEDLMDTERPIIETKELNARQKGYHYTVRNLYTEVWKQTKNSCLAICGTHMLTMLHRMDPDNRNLQLSPRGLLSKMGPNGISTMQLNSVITKWGEGLDERNDDEPFYEEVPTVVYRHDKRYKVECLHEAKGLYNIIYELRKNFDSKGRHYPMIGLCYPMGSLSQNAIALKTTMDNPYRWGDYNNADDIFMKIETDGLGAIVSNHAVLITGLYTMANNPGLLDYSIEIKNSMGLEWGDNAYAWVTADLFQAVIVPMMKGDILAI